MNYIDDDYRPTSLVEGKDFTMDPRGFRVMTKEFLMKRGYCCGSGCKNCPYFPKHQKGNTELMTD